MFQTFLIALTAVTTMLIYSVPGFLLIKTGVLSENATKSIVKVLLYVASPCISFYTFTRLKFSLDVLIKLGIGLLVCVAVETVFLAFFYFLWRKKYDNVAYRIATISTMLGNCTFFGMPVLVALFPENDLAIMYSGLFSFVQGVTSWTIVSTIISGDKKYISMKKAFLSPAPLATIIGFVFFLFSLSLPSWLDESVTVLGKMSTPLCMIIMGMRLATVNIKSFFNSFIMYISIAVKLIAFPLVTFLVVRFIPIDSASKGAFVMISACPCASMVLNFAEMLSNGEKEAANTVLISSIMSVITIPLISILALA